MTAATRIADLRGRRDVTVVSVRSAPGRSSIARDTRGLVAMSLAEGAPSPRHTGRKDHDLGPRPLDTHHPVRMWV
jgi:hypothetical protein